LLCVADVTRFATVDDTTASFNSIATRLIVSPTTRQKLLIASLHIEVKNGKFSQAEDEQIKKNWHEFSHGSEIKV
jgi:hypothetical protein